MTKPKVLFVASVAVHLHAFHRPYLKWFYDKGYEVHVACNGAFEDPHVAKVWSINFERSPFAISHASNVRNLQKIIEEQHYCLISCHTPMASVMTRLACIRARKDGVKLLYTAHGFHFFKGSGIWSWMTYYPVERLLSYFTDAIICINREDFDRIRHKGAGSIGYYLIPGVGVDSARFYPVPKSRRMELRVEIGLDANDFVLIYAAEFIERKNHRLVVNAVRELAPKIEKLKVVFAGRGELLDELKEYVNFCGVQGNFLFLGFVGDIEKCYQASDLAVSSSRQEGLGLNLVEAMMCGIPVVATIDRGHSTIVEDGLNGYLVPQNNCKDFSEAIYKMYVSPVRRARMGEAAIVKAAGFEIKKSLAAMSAIYDEHLKCNVGPAE